MKNIQAWSDKAAISLSLFCAIHCLLTPVAIALLPAIAGLTIADESMHLSLLTAVLPSSIFALALGCKKHKSYKTFILGFSGLLLLISAVIFGHDLGEFYEKGLTLVGAIIVASAHYWNYQLCQQADCRCTARYSTGK